MIETRAAGREDEFEGGKAWGKREVKREMVLCENQGNKMFMPRLIYIYTHYTNMRSSQKEEEEEEKEAAASEGGIDSGGGGGIF